MVDGHIMTPIQAIKYFEIEAITRDGYIMQLQEEKRVSVPRLIR